MSTARTRLLRPVSPITTQFLDRLANHRQAHAFALLEHAKLFARGFTNVLAITGQEHAIIAHHKNHPSGPKEIAGVIVFEQDDDEPTWWVTLIAVHPALRKQGVCGTLMRVIKGRAHNSCQKFVSIGTHVDNQDMRDTMQKLGHEVKYLQYEIKTGE